VSDLVLPLCLSRTSIPKKRPICKTNNLAAFLTPAVNAASWRLSVLLGMLYVGSYTGSITSLQMMDYSLLGAAGILSRRVLEPQRHGLEGIVADDKISCDAVLKIRVTHEQECVRRPGQAAQRQVQGPELSAEQLLDSIGG
jgi:hypothetical protein